jgi:hypothetical protein
MAKILVTGGFAITNFDSTGSLIVKARLAATALDVVACWALTTRQHPNEGHRRRDCHHVGSEHVWAFKYAPLASLCESLSVDEGH